MSETEIIETRVVRKNDLDRLVEQVEQLSEGQIERNAEIIRLSRQLAGAVDALREAAGALDWAASKITDAEANRHVRAMAVKARDAARGMETMGSGSGRNEGPL